MNRNIARELFKLLEKEKSVVISLFLYINMDKILTLGHLPICQLGLKIKHFPGVLRKKLGVQNYWEDTNSVVVTKKTNIFSFLTTDKLIPPDLTPNTSPTGGCDS